jgi:lipopolysaccharide transport system permease protein
MLGSIRREFEARYRNSLLGAAWAILQPLSMILVYTLIFSQIMKARLPGLSNNLGYSIYLCAGIIPWGLFSEIMLRGINVFTENANALKKIKFPHLCLPIIAIANSTLNFFIIFSIFTIFLAVSDNLTSLAYLATIPLTILLLFFAAGLSLFLGVLNVFFRDIGHFFGIILQFWFWLTPIVYPSSAIPEKARWIIEMNPMAIIVEEYQRILVHMQWPQWTRLTYPILAAVVLCLIGARLLRHRAGEMIDEL